MAACTRLGVSAIVKLEGLDVSSAEHHFAKHVGEGAVYSWYNYVAVVWQHQTDASAIVKLEEPDVSSMHCWNILS